MSCPIVIKTIDSLEEKGIYEHDTSRVLNKPAFIAYNDKWSQIAKDKFNLTNVDKMFNIVDGGLKKMLSGSSYLRDNTESITRAFVNQDFFNELQEKYDLANKPADTTVNRIKEVNNKQKIEVKPGVQELFKSNPELANAVYKALGFTGNISDKQKQQAQQVYSQYLDTIFPYSKVKDIVYHGSNQKIEQFEIRKEPLIHFGTKNAASQRGNVLNQAILNIKDLQTIKDGMWFLGTDEGGLLKELLDRNILTIEEVKSINEVKNKAIQQSPYFHENYRMALPDGEKAGNQKLLEILKDKNIGFEYINKSEDKGSTSYAVSSPEQIHILGSKQDIEGFKKFMKNTNKQNNTKIELNTDFDVDKLSDDLNLDKDCK